MASMIQTIDRFALGTDVTASHSRVYTLVSLGAAALLVLVLIFALNQIGTRQHASSMNHIQSQQSLPYPAKPSPTPAASNQTITEIHQSTSSSSPHSAPTTSARVEVNGKNVPLPSSGNGTVHKDVTSSDGSKASVDVMVHSSSSSDSSTFNLNINSDQSSSVNKSG